MTRRPKIKEVTELLEMAVQQNENANQAHLAVAKYFAGIAGKDEIADQLFAAVADAVDELQERGAERDCVAMARSLTRAITGRNGLE